MAPVLWDVPRVGDGTSHDLCHGIKPVPNVVPMGNPNANLTYGTCAIPWVIPWVILWDGLYPMTQATEHPMGQRMERAPPHETSHGTTYGAYTIPWDIAWVVLLDVLWVIPWDERGKGLLDIPGETDHLWDIPWDDPWNDP